jgi:protein-disulfide isomerase
VENVNPSEILIIGDPDAPVTIVEFSDFFCPFCSQASAIIEKLVEENRGKVRLIFMNYPLDKKCNVNMKNQLHPGACLLALGSISAAKQGMFKEYHDAAFRLQPKNPGKSEMEQIAALSGLNAELFFKDLGSLETQNELMDQLKRGWDLKVSGTPTIYINGKRYRYRPLKEILQEIIDQEYEAVLSGQSK